MGVDPKLIIGERLTDSQPIESDLPNVELDANRLKEALFVLVRNAREAMPAGGKLVISLRKREIDITRAQQLGLSQ